MYGLAMGFNLGGLSTVGLIKLNFSISVGMYTPKTAKRYLFSPGSGLGALLTLLRLRGCQG